jgi:hypothetical protein
LTCAITGSAMTRETAIASTRGNPKTIFRPFNSLSLLFSSFMTYVAANKEHDLFYALSSSLL